MDCKTLMDDIARGVALEMTKGKTIEEAIKKCIDDSVYSTEICLLRVEGLHKILARLNESMQILINSDGQFKSVCKKQFNKLQQEAVQNE